MSDNLGSQRTRLGGRRSMKLHPLDPHRSHPQPGEVAGGAVHRWEVHEDEGVPRALVGRPPRGRDPARPGAAGEHDHPPPAGPHRAPAHGRGRLAGNTFVLTGALRALTRDEAAERIAQRGGLVAGSVTRTTDYVVAGAEPGAKLARARALGVPILDERAFLARLR